MLSTNDEARYPNPSGFISEEYFHELWVHSLSHASGACQAGQPAQRCIMLIHMVSFGV